MDNIDARKKTRDNERKIVVKRLFLVEIATVLVVWGNKRFGNNIL